MEKILVTGAAGFIGLHVSLKLLELGYEVIGVDNHNDYYEVSLKLARTEILKSKDNFTFIKADLTEKAVLEKVIEEHSISRIIHLAAQAGVRYSIANPLTYIQNNIVVFQNILDCCVKYKMKNLLYASSSSVYGLGSGAIGGNKETDTINSPISPYAVTKITNENQAFCYNHIYDLNAIGLRFFTVYGEYGRPDMAYFLFAKKISNDETITVNNGGKMSRSFTYISDIVEGIIKIFEKEKPNHSIYNLGNDKTCDLMFFLSCIESSLGKNAKYEFAQMQDGDVKETYANVSRMREEFGYNPRVDLDQGIERFVNWYKMFYPKN